MSSAVATADQYVPWEAWVDDDQPVEPAWTPHVLDSPVAPEAEPTDVDAPSPGRAFDEAQFNFFADQLATAATVTSSTRRLARHPAYAEIMSMGKPALPLLLQRLGEPGARPVWLALLSSMTLLRPSSSQTVEGASADWLAWGKLEGLI